MSGTLNIYYIKMKRSLSLGSSQSSWERGQAGKQITVIQCDKYVNRNMHMVL